MHVLVTGASGFVGSHVARDLAARGMQVTAVGRNRPVAPASGVAVVHDDLSNPLNLPEGVDAVVHAAATSAWTGISGFEMVRDNAVATAKLVDWARATGVRAFLYCSSTSVYGEIDASEVDESTPRVDPDVYGTTKFLGETVLSEAAPSLAGLAMRLPGVIGSGARRNWLSGVAARLRSGEAVSIFNPDAAFNNAVHVADLAALCGDCIERGWLGFDVLTLGAGGCLRIREVVERLANALGVEAHLRVVDPLRSPFTVSSRRAIERYGYAPMSIDSMLERYAKEVA